MTEHVNMYSVTISTHESVVKERDYWKQIAENQERQIAEYEDTIRYLTLQLGKTL